MGTRALKEALICGVRGYHGVIVKTTAFCGVTPCILIRVCVSEKTDSSIFRTEDYAEGGRKSYTGLTFLL
jgi:hypothetical protein